MSYNDDESVKVGLCPLYKQHIITEEQEINKKASTCGCLHNCIEVFHMFLQRCYNNYLTSRYYNNNLYCAVLFVV